MIAITLVSCEIVSYWVYCYAPINVLWIELQLLKFSTVCNVFKGNVSTTICIIGPGGSRGRSTKGQYLHKY